MTLTPERIEEIMKRADAATAAPWSEDRPPQDDDSFFTRGTAIAHVARVPIYADAPPGVFPAADRAFICHARTDIPDLLASHESLRLQLDEANARRVVDEDARPFEGFTETFKPSRDDLDALRRDAAEAVERGERFSVSVNVAPAVIYLAWPNGDYVRDKDGGASYRCISLHIPLPKSPQAIGNRRAE